MYPLLPLEVHALLTCYHNLSYLVIFSWPLLLEDTSSSSSQGPDLLQVSVLNQGPDLLLKDELLNELLLLGFNLGQSSVLGGESVI